MVTTVPSKRLLPVIHCICPWEEGGIEHALTNTKVALENGADGVFLIGHSMRHKDLIYIYNQVRNQYPEAWIGINFLDLTTTEIKKRELLAAISKCTDLSAIWMDTLPEEDLNISEWIEIFAGVAFKYRNAGAVGEEIMSECARANAYTNFATTSGDETGSPPKLEKLKAIHHLLKGVTLLAVASGVDEKNVREMLPYVNTFLVASSICLHDPRHEGHEYLVPKRVRTLAHIIHQYKPPLR